MSEHNLCKNVRGDTLIIAALLAIAAIPALAAPSAKDIMLKNEDARRLKDVISSAALVTGGGGTAERSKKFTWWRKLSNDGVRFNTLTRFHAPAEIRNEGILFLEHEKDESDVMLYLPTYKKVRRIERQNQSGSFMGSELSYADIATPHVEDFNFTLVREEACPATATLKCAVVESKPARPETLERTGYSRTVQWVRQDNFMAEKAENYDKDGALWKTIALSGIREVDKGARKWMAHKLFVSNVKNGKFTRLEFSDVKVNTGIADSVFTQQNLSAP